MVSSSKARLFTAQDNQENVTFWGKGPTDFTACYKIFRFPNACFLSCNETYLCEPDATWLFPHCLVRTRAQGTSTNTDKPTVALVIIESLGL